jgi:hypothetical protein
MDHSEFNEWIKSKELLQTLSKWKKPMSEILKNNFDPYKRAVIVSDYGYPTSKVAPMLAKLYSLALEKNNIPYKMILQEPKSSDENADKKIIQELFDADTDTLLLMCFSKRIGSLGHLGKSFRKYARKNKISFLSSSGLSELKTEKFPEFMESIDLDYIEMSRKGKMLKEILDKGKKMKIKTSKGTDIVIDISDFKAVINDGLYHEKRGGNMPVGEVYIAPNKRTAQGKVIIDISSKNSRGTYLIKEPMEIIFEKGEAVQINGANEAEELNRSLEWVKEKAKYPWGIKLLSEIGIGINPKAKILGPTVINEKKVGTAHIALGSNSWFGGNIFALNHYDQVFNNPKIEIDGIPIDLKSILGY